MKRSPLKRKSKTSEAKLKQNLWAIVSKRIKERDKNICFTSKKFVTGSNAHCGHGLASSICGGRLRWHPKNLHCQSYHENINLGGNGSIYYQEQVKAYGQEVVDKLYALQQKFIKVDRQFLERLIKLYTNGTWEEIEQFLES